jgi:hypothetical protein
MSKKITITLEVPKEVVGEVIATFTTSATPINN